ncbi:MAG: hypothetical protein VX737_01145, partial [Pseudomonadota bacterium]|nr:hypothetical protein [Pseudomonadota bacterium]
MGAIVQDDGNKALFEKIKRLKENAIARKNSPKRKLASLIKKTKEEDKARDEFIKKLKALEERYEQLEPQDSDAQLLLSVDEEKTASSIKQVEVIYNKLPARKTTFCLDFDGCSDVQHMLGEQFDSEKYAFRYRYEEKCKPIIQYALFGTRSAPQGNVGKRGQWLRDNTPALKEIHQTIQTSKPEDTITIITGSNRQSEKADKDIADSKEGITCDQTLRMITDVMAKNGVKAEFSPSLLSEFNGNESFTEGCLLDDS